MAAIADAAQAAALLLGALVEPGQALRTLEVAGGGACPRVVMLRCAACLPSLRHGLRKAASSSADRAKGLS